MIKLKYTLYLTPDGTVRDPWRTHIIIFLVTSKTTGKFNRLYSEHAFVKNAIVQNAIIKNVII